MPQTPLRLGPTDLREFLAQLRQAGELVEVEEEVSPHLELAEIHRRVVAAEGPALLFRRVEGSSFPVVTNLFGSSKRVEMAFGGRPEAFLNLLLSLLQGNLSLSPSTFWKHRELLMGLFRLGRKRVKAPPLFQAEMAPPDLTRLPMLTSWKGDGGAFLTLPLVYTADPSGKKPPNLGMYRIQRYGPDRAGLHFQIGKGGGFHFAAAEDRGEPLPVTIFLGGPPALMLSAIAPLPENVPELLFASFVQGSRLAYSKKSSATSHPLLAACEFALVGYAPPGVREPEGPFGDHYGYYSLAHPFPLFCCTRLFHRRGAIYPATVVGKPRQEDYYIGEYLQELLSPLFPLVMPAVREVWSFGETGFHSLAAARVRESYRREVLTSGFRILGEGQLALTKFLLLTDQPCNLRDIREVLTKILERADFRTDLYIFSNLSMDTLDYTGPRLNEGSRGILLGVGEAKRTLPQLYRGPLPSPFRHALPFSPGVLLLEVEGRPAPSTLPLADPSFSDWPLLILVDDAKQTAATPASFLWRVFTRFEPAADLHAQALSVERHHLSYLPPILIDARAKKEYPPEVLVDRETDQLVTKRWHRYFPEGMEMGESQGAHVG